MAKLKAKESIQKLGMEALDIENNKHVIEAIKDLDNEQNGQLLQSQYDGGEPNQEFSGDQTENILCNTEKSACIETIVKDVCIEDPSEIQKDINILSSSGLLTDQVK